MSELLAPEADLETGKKPRRVGDGTPGPGRPKGLQNRTTAAVKEALGMAFEGIGGVARLQTWAEENTTEFYKLWSKLIPVEVKAEHSGPGGGPVETSITVRLVGPKGER